MLLDGGMHVYGYRTLLTDVAELAQAVFVERLNELGAEGWQLVATVPHDRQGRSHEVNLVFMRRVEPPAK